MNRWRAYLLQSAADHYRDGHCDEADAMLRMKWAVQSRATLERVLRDAVSEWDEETLRRTLDAAERGGDNGDYQGEREDAQRSE